MDYKSEYQKWISSPRLDAASKAELSAVAGDETELKSRFGASLEFGTAGLRGVMGAGLNRMNVYIIRQVTQALAGLVKQKNGQDRGVAIAYDCRHNSQEFAAEAACVLAAAGVKVYLFDDMRPTPELSFTIRKLRCISGINVTASHNPREYNGYKVYWEDGAQLAPEHSDVVLEEIGKLDIFEDVRTMDLEAAKAQGLITMIGGELDEQYLAAVLAQSQNPELAARSDMGIVYTPFHGAGRKLVPEVLSRVGFKRVLTVPEQMIPDGGFPTVKSPNPENPEGFTLAIALAKKENCEFIVGTDPDADRIGMVARDEDGEYRSFTGTQIGILLLSYLIDSRKEQGRLPEGSYAIKSIVTSYLANEICRQNGVECADVFTGFKFVGEKMEEFEAQGNRTFVFAFEESNGYLAGTYARDKDGVVASMLACEMAAWHRSRGRSLFDALDDIYSRYGWHMEQVDNIQYTGIDASSRMKAMMENLRANLPVSIGSIPVLETADFLAEQVTETKTGEKRPTGMQRSNVMGFILEDGSRVYMRPSGTEPKVKLYFLIKGENAGDCGRKLDALVTDFRKIIG